MWGRKLAWARFVDRTKERDQNEILAALVWANDSFRESLKAGSPVRGLSCQAISRLLLFEALCISDDGRQQRRHAKESSSNTNAPKWTELKRRIETFVSETAPPQIAPLLCRTYTDDKIAQLGTLAARSRGSTDNNFFSTILLYLMHQDARGAFKNEFLHAITSPEDQRFSRSAGTILIDRLTGGNRATVDEKTREIRPLFVVREDQHSKFEEYFRRHSVPRNKEGKRTTQRQLQCIVYRPMRTNPCEVMKTYVSVYEQRSSALDSGGFSYTHIYDPPKAVQQKRFSGGRVLPLDDGIYLLGGQRPLEEYDNPKPLPFDSLKVIAIRWHDIQRFHSILPALVMTTNYAGKLMVTRAAMRLTPIRHSGDLRLKSVPFLDLETDLMNDLEQEEAEVASIEGITETEISAMKEVFPLLTPDFSPSETADQIARICNNDPHTEAGWSAPSGFSRKGGRRGDQRLTTESLNYMISNALGESDTNNFQNEKCEAFNLWLHTRFGPLSLD